MEASAFEVLFKVARSRIPIPRMPIADIQAHNPAYNPLFEGANSNVTSCSPFGTNTPRIR